MKRSPIRKKFNSRAAFAFATASIFACMGAIPAAAIEVGEEVFERSHVSGHEITPQQSLWIGLANQDCRSIPGHVVYIASTGRGQVTHHHRTMSGTIIPRYYNNAAFTFRREHVSLQQENGPTAGFQGSVNYRSASSSCDV